MKFSSSISLWSYILCVTFLIGPNKVEACDDAFKETLIQELKSVILGDLKMALVDDFKLILETKMKLVDQRFDQSENTLKLLTGSVHTIEGEVEAITGRSGESQLNIEDVKEMQKTMVDQLVILKENVDIVDKNINEMKHEGDETLDIIINMGNDTLLELKNVSESLEEKYNDLQFLNNETTEFIKQISRELATNINESTKITEKLESELQMIRNPITDINSKLTAMINESATQGEDINEVKEMNENSSKTITKQLSSIITKATTLEEDVNEVKDMADDSFRSIYEQLVTIASEQDANSYKINQKLDHVEKLSGCPDGFFKVEASGQCFKFYEPRESWTAAKAKCEAENLVIAKPYDPLALRDYIHWKYGTSSFYTWIGARGVGSTVAWIHDGKTLSADNPMWASGQPGSYTSSTYCLSLATTDWQMRQFPVAPYVMYTCTNTAHTICELFRE